MEGLSDVLKGFIVNYCEFMPPTIPRLNEIPTVADFLHKHVETSFPCVVTPKNGIFPRAVENWKDSNHLIELMKDASVTVAVTPDGKADAVTDGKFMIPEERRMSFNTYMDHFLKPNPNQIHYIQKQNDNLITEFAPLIPEVSKDVPWATEAFGCKPEVANIWMGDRYSFTTMHKDYYENVYIVIRGVKTFTIFPPASMAWMPYETFPKYQWNFKSGRWQMKYLNEKVNWIRPDLKAPTNLKFKMFTTTKGYTVTLSAGEALYLPAMWFHEVTQSNQCIAINFWYEMNYQQKYPYFNLLEKLSELADASKDDQQGELED